MKPSLTTRQLWYAAIRLHLLEQMQSLPFWENAWARKQAVQILKRYATQTHEPAAWWPALSRLVETEHDDDILNELATWPLPAAVPPGAAPWHTALVATWDRKKNAAADDARKGFAAHNTALKALVRLDGCGMSDGGQRPSRLPEWLEETRQIQQWTKSLRSQKRLETLALWRPAHGVVTSPEDLRQWQQFWEHAHGMVWKLGDDRLIPIILQAQLNCTTHQGLNEATTAGLLEELGAYVRKAASGTAHLNIWQPAAGQMAGQEAFIRLTGTLLNAAVFLGNFEDRQGVWQMLLALERAGLHESLRKEFLIVFDNALRNDPYLWPILSKWVPSPALVADPATGNHLTAIRNVWVDISRQSEGWVKRWGWNGRFSFQAAGIAPDKAGEEIEELCRSIRTETSDGVLTTLAVWQPPAHLPAERQTAWRRSWGTTLTHLEDGAMAMFPGWLALEHHREYQILPPEQATFPHWWAIRNICHEMHVEIPELAKVVGTGSGGFRFSRVRDLLRELACQTPADTRTAIDMPAKTPFQPIALPRPESRPDNTGPAIPGPPPARPEST